MKYKKEFHSSALKDHNPYKTIYCYFLQLDANFLLFYHISEYQKFLIDWPFCAVEPDTMMDTIKVPKVYIVINADLIWSKYSNQVPVIFGYYWVRY